MACLLGSCGGGSSDGSSGGGSGSLQPGTLSTNFSGYQLAGAPGGFKTIHGSWTVPDVSDAAADTKSSTWAGIGGGCANPPECTLVEPLLIQAGTEQDKSGDQPSYFAWFEALPAPQVEASGASLDGGTFDVLPGDRITVDVDGSDAVVWMITIVDERGGAEHWTFNTTVPYVVPGLTAEWIVEAPLSLGPGGTGQAELANFGRVSFSDLTVNGANPALAPSDSVIMVDGTGKVVLANPSAPSGDGDAFDDCFGAAPCS